MPAERTWANMSKRERLALLAESGRGQTDMDAWRRIMARVEKHFRGQRTARLNDPSYAMNVMLRESWREEHGNTDEWDRAAAAALSSAVPRG